MFIHQYGYLYSIALNVTTYHIGTVVLDISTEIVKDPVV